MSNIDAVPREKPWSRAKTTSRRKIKGCFECSRRRIDCDRTAPQCRKCLNKGYQCSGIGLRYRFSIHALPTEEAPVLQNSRCSKRKVLSTSSSYRSEPKSIIESISEGPKEQAEEHISGWRFRSTNVSDIDKASVFVQPVNQRQPVLPEITCSTFPQIASVPDHLNGSTRFLLNYFSSVIAPILAVIDRGFNGYRDLFLPIAEYDPLVRKVIIIACTEHISLRFNGDITPDRQAYNEVLSGLRTRAQTIIPYQDDISLMILLLLLLCEMISGSSGLNQIYGILRNLFRNAGPDLQFSKSDLGRFLKVQILRVRLVGESLFDEAEGSSFVQVQLQSCLAFLRFCHALHPEFTDLMSLLFDLMTQASHIYVQRAINDPPPPITTRLVERFVQTAELVSEYEDTVGHHLLLWPYFLAGAESHDKQHRDYFVAKLEAMHRKTSCENASRAIVQMKGIWELKSTTTTRTRWTSLLGGPEQIFIM